jgi:hypothetical protein
MTTLMQWVRQCKEFIEEDDHIFDNMEELAKKLEEWRMMHKPKDIRCRDAVEIILYGDHEILITDKIKAEFIRITKEATHVQSTGNHS